jgi:predicted kinase
MEIRTKQMYIYNYTNFLLEFAKSDPIPELTYNKRGKTMVFLFGTPAAGKSDFTRNFLLPKISNYKIFDPDTYINKLIKLGKEKVVKTSEEKLQKLNAIRTTIQRLQTEYSIPIILSDEEIMNIIENNVYVKGVNELIEKQLLKFMHVNKYSDIVYDTTGNDFERISKYSKIARENGYVILFLKVKSSVETAVMSNLKRPERRVQLDYQLSSIEKSEELEKNYLKLNPDAYYIYDRDNNILSKYENGQLVIKKQSLFKNEAIN